MAGNGIEAYSLAERVREGELTASELADECLNKISVSDQHGLNAFVYVDAGGARRAAEAIDAKRRQGHPLGPLAGVPFGVKELQQVTGWPDTLASMAFKDRVAGVTDTMVNRLIAADAVPVGLTASPELGRSSFCSTSLHGTTRNPWDPDLTPGGSSSGSAVAVAADITSFCTGSDGAGSLRIPASFCGVVGMKPSRGVVPRGPQYGGSSETQVYGPIANNVHDVALVLDCVTGIVDGEFGSATCDGQFVRALESLPRGLRVAYSPDLGYAAVEKNIIAATTAKYHEFVNAIDGVKAEVPDGPLFPDTGKAFRTLSMLDVWAQVRDLSEEKKELLSPSVRQYSEYVAQTSFDDYIDALQDRSALTQVVAKVFEHVDLLVTPTTPVTAFAAEGPMPTHIDGQAVDHWGSLRLTYPFNLTGHPAISMPITDIGGAPIGMQIVARRFDDKLLVSAARKYEASQVQHESAQAR